MAAQMSIEPLHLLLVEDHEGDAELLRAVVEDEVEGQWEIDHVLTLAAALEALRDERAYFDVVLLDLGLPDANGLGIVERVKAQAPELPLIILTGRADRDLAFQALREGVQDYLLKDNLRGDYIYSAVLYAIERNRVSRELDAMTLALWRDDPENIASIVGIQQELAVYLTHVDDLSRQLDLEPPQISIQQVSTQIREAVQGMRNVLHTYAKDNPSGHSDELSA